MNKYRVLAGPDQEVVAICHDHADAEIEAKRAEADGRCFINIVQTDSIAVAYERLVSLCEYESTREAAEAALEQAGMAAAAQGASREKMIEWAVRAARELGLDV